MSERTEVLKAVARTGLLRPTRPDRVVRAVRQIRRWGPSAAGAVAMSAARHPHRAAIIDERGTLDWEGLDRHTSAIANAFIERGIGPGHVLGLLCRNHRGFVEALVAAGKVGADVVLLNTGFSSRQLGEVVGREGVTVLVHDASFADVVAGADLEPSTPRFVADPLPASAGGAGPDATTLDATTPDATTLDDLAAASSSAAPEPPSAPGQVTILSSGTTGTPKGARRSTERTGSRDGAGSTVGILTRVPLRSGDPTLISAPMFHSWGLSGFLTAAMFSSPMVLRERFDAEDALRAIAAHRVGTLVAVPVMVQRILELGPEAAASHDTSTLRVVFLSGSALPADLAVRWMDRFGDNLYNLYGSTEVAVVAVADPSDMRAAPDTAGPVVPGVDVRLLDHDGRVVPSGSPGRIFVRTGMAFDGYTDGATKEVVDGYMSTGDVGHFDDAGRLYVDGREDDMIVSGGENVVPREVEDVLMARDDIADVAVVGVPDPDFGQRLVAHVVAADGATPTAAELTAWVKDNLAGYKVPRDVVFTDRLPRNPTGKILRRKLLDPASDAPAEE